jgi:LysM repeat protein
MNYIIKQGDSLSKIARDKLGNMKLWEELARINNIHNPNLIYPGQVISLDVPNRTIIDITDAQGIVMPGQHKPADIPIVIGCFVGVGLMMLAVKKLKSTKTNAKNA